MNDIEREKDFRPSIGFRLLLHHNHGSWLIYVVIDDERWMGEEKGRPTLVVCVSLNRQNGIIWRAY